MIKLLNIKFHCGVSCGNKVDSYFKSPEFELFIDDQLVHLYHSATNTKSLTHVSNMQWAVEMPPEVIAPPKAPKAKKG